MFGLNICNADKWGKNLIYGNEAFEKALKTFDIKLSMISRTTNTVYLKYNKQ